MLQKLDEMQPRLVDYHKRQGVTLTEDGRRAALSVIRRHRLVEQFLFEVLGYSWEEVHAEAEVLEHVISDHFEDRLAALLGEPRFDPHGEPIPDRELGLGNGRRLAALCDVPAGERAVVRQVAANQPGLLVYLKAIGVALGTELTVTQRNPLDGALLVKIEAGGALHAISREAASAVEVERMRE
ncbi:metal-dependent transcriptional regulator [bacterium]|nr:MAG: metal-dependent transcriptional regulator [bacterium]